MTQMSDHRRSPTGRLACKRLTSQAGSPLARPLHDIGRLVRALPFVLLAGGCVIPPSLSSNTSDAGVNSPPMIVDVKSQVALKEGAPETFPVLNPDPLTIDLLDTDVNDTLYVRIFVDYNNLDATPVRVQCGATGASKTAQRALVCNINGLCESKDVGTTHSMSIVVFDRQPLDDGSQPLYQAMPPDGLSTDRFYYLNCQ